MPYQIQTINNISPLGLKRFDESKFTLDDGASNPDAIMLRSQKLHDMQFGDQLKAVGRAGAGVNNIPVERLTELGVPVFNAPGANANAVKELVLAALFMAERNLYEAVDYTGALSSSGDELDKEVEGGKKKFVGRELPGRTLGVIGLGAIGVEVANAAAGLGMDVVAFDPGLTVANAWKLNRIVEKAGSIDDVFARSEFVTVHVPLIDATKNLVNAERIATMPDGAVVLNFARAGIVDDAAVLKALTDGKLKRYVTDFPTRDTIDHAGVITMPHMGASTAEAEVNCAIMVADQLQDFLEHGNIRNSVNFPNVELSRKSDYRLVIIHKNVPDMVGQISHQLGQSSVNIEHMINESKGAIAYTLIDVEKEIPSDTLEAILSIEGIMKVRKV